MFGSRTTTAILRHNLARIFPRHVHTNALEKVTTAFGTIITVADQHAVTIDRFGKYHRAITAPIGIIIHGIETPKYTYPLTIQRRYIAPDFVTADNIPVRIDAYILYQYDPVRIDAICRATESYPTPNIANTITAKIATTFEKYTLAEIRHMSPNLTAINAHADTLGIHVFDVQMEKIVTTFEKK